MYILTEREAEVFKYIAKGLNDKEIAKELIISHRTVSVYVTRVLIKTNSKTRTQAIYKLCQEGIKIQNQSGKTKH